MLQKGVRLTIQSIRRQRLSFMRREANKLLDIDRKHATEKEGYFRQDQRHSDDVLLGLLQGKGRLLYGHDERTSVRLEGKSTRGNRSQCSYG